MGKLALSVDDEQLTRWCNQFPKNAQAMLCVRYALAYNTMDVNWLKGTLAPTVTYGSQSVSETLQGKSPVWDYLSGKISHLRTIPERQPRCELGINEMDEPCVLMYQPQGFYDRAWLEVPLARVDIKQGVGGMAREIFMITAVPSPASALRSGIFPGIKKDAHENARRFIRPGNDYKGLRFSFFLLDGEMQLDRKMLAEAETALAAFPGALKSILITTQRTSAADELDEAGFVGFPSVAVFWQDEIIFRHEGLIASHNLIQKIKEITVLHVHSAMVTHNEE
jgi:hypothetical protein